jgi:hypothetical protein
MEYFGTNLTEYGHYRWNLENDHMRFGKNLLFSDLPFHPEYLTNNLPAGKVVFYQGGGYTVIGISGSCKDERGGTESIFWVKEIISRSEMIDRIISHPAASKIIQSMPFEIDWES